MRLAHVVNPVFVRESSDLYQAQPITFDSMSKALSFSANKDSIYQFAIGYEEDRKIFPDEFIELPYLNRSVLDTNKFNESRKLPLLVDILRPLKDFDVDYIVYTNVDIALMPYFYDYVFSKIKNGSDSLIINRRVIPSVAEFSLMYANIGKPHPGYDCFVFRKDMLQFFDLGDICIGANWIGRALIANLTMFSRKLEIVKDAHLTFHVGEDGAWLSGKFHEFDAHNKKVTYDIVQRFLSKVKDKKKKRQLLEIKQYMDGWGNVKNCTEPARPGNFRLGRLMRRFYSLIK